MNQQELFDKVVAISMKNDCNVVARDSDVMSEKNAIVVESFISSPTMKELSNELSVFYNDFERSIIVY